MNSAGRSRGFLRQQRPQPVARAQLHARIERMADEPRLARLFQGFGHGGTHREQPIPFRRELLVLSRRLRNPRQQYARWPRPGRQMRPDLVGGEGQDRRHQTRHRVQDLPQGRLRRTPARRRGGGAVQPVLDDVEIQRAQIDRTEVDQLLHHEMEAEALVRLARARRSARRCDAGSSDPARAAASSGKPVALRIEIVEVAEQEAAGVADLAVRLQQRRQQDSSRSTCPRCSRPRQTAAAGSPRRAP